MAFAIRHNCYICDRRQRPQNTVSIHGEERIEICQIAIARREEFDRPYMVVNEQTRICQNCYQSILDEIRAIQNNPMSIRLKVLRQSRNNSCFICDEVNDIHRLSDKCKVKVFVDCDIFFPVTVRSCNDHLDDDGYILRPLLNGLRSIERTCIIPGQYLQMFLQKLREFAQPKKSICDLNDLTDAEMCKLTSLTKAQFNELYEYCHPIEREDHRGMIYITRKDLLMFLCKLRQGLSDDFASLLFQYNSRGHANLAVTAVRKSLMIHFVPHHLGFHHITREEFIELHVTDFAKTLYNPDPRANPAIVYIDGTYTYCHRSRNFRALRQSYCRHKARHLIKPALICAPNGYILDVQGPYFSDAYNNDAEMLRNELEFDWEINQWFRRGDIVIVDRGYRDIRGELENMGLIVKMPPLLAAGEQQLSTADANEARLITKTRWIIESKNGHVKLIFKYLNQVQQVHVLPHIGAYYRIAAAIMNRFRQMIYMRNATVADAQEMLERSLVVNHVQNRVLAENLRARNAQRWLRLNQGELNDFPRLSLQFLERLTVGIFQLELAKSYIQDTVNRETDEQLQVEVLLDENRIPEPGFMRVRVFSRFSNTVRYQLWISYEPNARNEPIRGYYCTCRSGARTLGTCSHIASVMWYLGYARFEENVQYPSRQLINGVNAIGDAAHRPPQFNPDEDDD